MGIPHFNSVDLCMLIILFSHLCGASLVAQMVKNLPAMQETWVQSLCEEDALENGLKPTLVFLPGKFHGQRNLVCYNP